MYKQKCVGMQGEVLPKIAMLAVALILYSMTYTGVRFGSWSAWSILVVVCFYAWLCFRVWRYTCVKIEYTWFGGELVIRAGTHIWSHRSAVRSENMRGLRAYGIIMAGELLPHTRCVNGCATLLGRLIGHSTLYYLDANGHGHRLYFEPTQDLREMLVAAIREQKK